MAVVFTTNLPQPLMYQRVLDLGQLMTSIPILARGLFGPKVDVSGFERGVRVGAWGM